MVTQKTQVQSKERILEIIPLDFLGEDSAFPNVLASSIEEIRGWMESHLPEDFDREEAMRKVLKIRREAGIVNSK